MSSVTKAERCDTCGNFQRLDADGWLFPHYVTGSTTEVCMGRVPRQARASEYTVGYDSDPWVMRGGLPETNRRRF